MNIQDIMLRDIADAERRERGRAERETAAQGLPPLPAWMVNAVWAFSLLAALFELALALGFIV